MTIRIMLLATDCDGVNLAAYADTKVGYVEALYRLFDDSGKY